MSTFNLSLKIDQGATYSKKAIWKSGNPAQPVNLTGCTAKMHVKDKVGSPTTLLELTTENGGIVLGGVLSSIEFCKLSAAATSQITWTTGVYDLKIIFPDQTVKRKIAGNIVISPQITNA